MVDTSQTTNSLHYTKEFKPMNFSTFSLTELKAYAAANNIEVTGDKRCKASFIASIEAWLGDTGYYDYDSTLVLKTNEVTDIWNDNEGAEDTGQLQKTTAVESIGSNSKSVLLPMFFIALSVTAIVAFIMKFLANTIAFSSKLIPIVVKCFDWCLKGFLGIFVWLMKPLLGDDPEDELDSHYQQVKILFSD